jgi:hypothetical protein
MAELSSYYNTPASGIWNINTPNPAGVIQVDPRLLDPMDNRVKSIVDPNPPPKTYVRAAPTEESSVFPGPLNKKYIHTEGVPSTNEDGEATGSVNHGYLSIEPVKGIDGVVRNKTNIYFNKNLLSPDPITGGQDEQQMTTQRTLALMADAIDSGHASMVNNVTETEKDEATKLFSNTKNANSMNAITRAYALVKRSSDNTVNAENDDAVNGWVSYFENSHSRQSPGQFLAKGDVRNQQILLPDEFESQRAAVARIRNTAIAQIPDIDLNIGKNLQASQDALIDYNKQLDNVNNQIKIPGITKDKMASLKEQAVLIGHNIQDTTANISSSTAQITLYNARREAVMQQANLNDLASKRMDEIDRAEAASIDTTKAQVELRKKFPGSSPGDADRFDGMIMKGFVANPIWREFKTTEPIYDQNGRKTGGFRETRVNPLDVPQYLLDRNMGKQLAKLTADSPDPERFNNKDTGADAMRVNYKGNIELLKKLYQGNEELIAKHGIVPATLDKIFYDSNSTLAVMSATQKQLVGKVRISMVGPGKMSNFEYEQLLQSIPNPGDTFQVASRVKARIQAVAMVSAMDYISRQSQNGLVPTTDTFRRMNRDLSEILGKKLTPADFQTFYTEGKKFETTYDSMEGNSKDQKELAAKHIDSLYEMLKTPKEARYYGGLGSPASKK